MRNTYLNNDHWHYSYSNKKYFSDMGYLNNDPLTKNIPYKNHYFYNKSKWNKYYKRQSYFSDLGYLNDKNHNNFLKRAKPRRKTKQEKISIKLWKAFVSVESNPIKIKWRRIINKFIEKNKPTWCNIMDVLLNRFSKNYKKYEDLLWVDAKISKEI